MSVIEIHKHAQQRKQRLWNPINAVPDQGIDLKRDRPLPFVRQAMVEPFLPSPPLVTPAPEIAEPAPVTEEAPQPVVVSLRGHALVRKAIWIVEDHYSLDHGGIKSRDRNTQIVYGRFIAMTLARRMTPMSLPEIGRLFGRDHTAVLHGLRRIEAKAEADPSVDTQLDFLEAKIKAAMVQA